MHFDHGIPVIDERPVRISAGILFGLILLAIFNFMRTGDFTPIYLFVGFISIDLLIRILINPKFSPTIAIGNLFTRSGTPHWIGIPQKKFAWTLGLVLALVMVSSTFLLGERNPIASLSCMACLMLLMYESIFGVCVGCTLYGKLFPNKPTVCPDGSCEIKTA
ncbi:MAG: hypothetical protein RL038_1146 [Actinomycetota bacterium]